MKRDKELYNQWKLLKEHKQPTTGVWSVDKELYRLFGDWIYSPTREIFFLYLKRTRDPEYIVMAQEHGRPFKHNEDGSIEFL
jgi:hypothetical protein